MYTPAKLLLTFAFFKSRKKNFQTPELRMVEKDCWEIFLKRRKNLTGDFVKLAWKWRLHKNTSEKEIWFAVLTFFQSWKLYTKNKSKPISFLFFPTESLYIMWGCEKLFRVENKDRKSEWMRQNILQEHIQEPSALSSHEFRFPLTQKNRSNHEKTKKWNYEIRVSPNLKARELQFKEQGQGTTLDKWGMVS